METQKNSNSQNNTEEEKLNWRNQPSQLQTILQSHSHQNSMVLAKRQIYRSMDQNRKPRDKSTRLCSPLSSTKEERIYNGKKTASLTSGAGKIGKQLVKE